MQWANNLKIDRVYKAEELQNKIKVKKSEDLVIEGVGFITFNKGVEIAYEIINNVNIYTRKAL